MEIYPLPPCSRHYFLPFNYNYFCLIKYFWLFNVACHFDSTLFKRFYPKLEHPRIFHVHKILIPLRCFWVDQLKWPSNNETMIYSCRQYDCILANWMNWWTDECQKFIKKIKERYFLKLEGKYTFHKTVEDTKNIATKLI